MMINLNDLNLFILSFVIKGSLLLLCAYLLSIIYKQEAASMRYLLKISALLAILILPLLYYSLPSWQLDLLDSPQVAERTVNQSGNDLPEIKGPAIKVPDLSPVNQQKERSFLAEFSWPEILWSVYALGLIFLLFRLVLGLFNVWLIARKSQFNSNDEVDLLNIKLANGLGLKHNPKIRMSSRIDSPMTWGIRRHIILLPDYCQDWDITTFKMVLTHELAHIKRNDFLFHIIIQVAAAVFWFNPLTWSIIKQAINDREEACDDQVVEQGNAAGSYANHLLEIARTLTKKRHMTLGTTCMAKANQLEGRLISILDKDKNRSMKRSTGRLIKLNAAIAIVLMALIQPWLTETTAQASEMPAKTELAEDNAVESQEQDMDESQFSDDVLKELKKYKEAGLIDYFSAADILRFLENKITIDDVKAFNNAGLLAIYDAENIIAILKAKIPLDFIRTIDKHILDDISIESLEQMHGDPKLTEYVKSFAAKGLMRYYSVEEIELLTDNKIPMGDIEAFRDAGLIDKFSAEGLVEFKRNSISIEQVKSYAKINKFSDMFGAEAVISFIQHQIPVSFVENVMNRFPGTEFSEEGIRKLYVEKVDLSILNKYDEARFLGRFSIDDILLLEKEKISIERIKEYRDAGLLRHLSGEQLIELERNKIDINFLKKLNEEGLLEDLDTEDIIYMVKKKIALTTIKEYRKENYFRYFNLEKVDYLLSELIDVKRLNTDISTMLSHLFRIRINGHYYKADEIHSRFNELKQEGKFTYISEKQFEFLIY